MKKLKWLVAFLIVANLLLGVIGCKDPEIHIHTYSEAWTSDANGHWHEATCEHTTEVSGKAEHTFGDWKVTQEPTEEAEGSREKSCTVCEYTVPEVIEKLAHTHKFATDWTSDETNHWHASTCGHDVIEGKAEHSFGEYVSNNDATTEADGTKTRECSVCGYKDTVTDEGSKIHVHTFAEEWTSDSSGHWHAATCEHTTEVRGKAKHTFGDWTTTKEATEEEVGSKERVCSVCNYKETAEIEKLAHTHKFSSDWTYDGTHHWYAATCEHTTEVSDKAEHTFGNWTTTKAATEEAEGTKERSCTVCGYTATEVISKLDHTHKFATDWTKDATHHWKAATCEHTDEKSEKAVHVFGNWTVTKAATEEAEGTKERSCTVCGYTATEAIEKLAHTHKFATDWTKDETHHWHGATCEHTTEVSDKAEHTFGEWTTTKDPTEEVEGSKERICTVCGYTATEAIEKLAHTHKFATDWTKDETHHWHAATCEHTTEVSEKAAHTFGNWTTTKEATEEAEGSRERSCTVCGYTATETIEKLAHTHKFSNDWTYDGTHHWKAAKCEHTSEVSEKAEHTFGEWEVTKEASCTEKGERKATCTICSYEKTEGINKAEHTYTNGICICGLPEGFVLIPAGTFQMGSEKGYADNKPVHQVTITKDFYMGKYEVTQAEYEKYCSYTGSNSPSSIYGDGDNYPAYYVSWYDALVYCNKRSIAEGLTPCYSISGNTDPSKWGTVPTSSDSTWNAVVCDWNANGYRLPTEAEWEYAARAGDNTVSSLTYAGTNSESNLGEYAWYYDNSSDKTHPVGTKKSNAFGLYDMSGNVWEWCWNWYTSSYNTGTEGGSDPTGATSGSNRVCRGGSWYSNALNASVSRRVHYYPSYRYDLYGFRVVRPSSN